MSKVAQAAKVASLDSIAMNMLRYHHYYIIIIVIVITVIIIITIIIIVIVMGIVTYISLTVMITGTTKYNDNYN